MTQLTKIRCSNHLVVQPPGKSAAKTSPWYRDDVQTRRVYVISAALRSLKFKVHHDDETG